MREELINYGYHWLGMQKISYGYAKLLLQDKKPSEVCLLYEDDTESYINENKNALEELENHYKKGGLIGIPLKKYDDYVVFVLGRDLLKGILPNENDIAYNICVDIAKDFEISEFNVNTKGLWECLEDYIKTRFYMKDGKLTYMGVDLDEMFGGFYSGR